MRPYERRPDGTPILRSNLTVSIPVDLKLKAIQHKIPFSWVMEDALTELIAEIEAEEAEA